VAAAAAATDDDDDGDVHYRVMVCGTTHHWLRVNQLTMASQSQRPTMLHQYA